MIRKFDLIYGRDTLLEHEIVAQDFWQSFSLTPLSKLSIGSNYTTTFVAYQTALD